MQRNITKGEYANAVVNEFCREMHLNRECISSAEWRQLITGKPSLAVCVEFLNLLDEKDLYYSAFKEGYCEVDPETYKVVTTREFLDSLPDDKLPEKQAYRLSGEFSLKTLMDLFRSEKLDDYKFNIDIRVYLDRETNQLTITDNIEKRKVLDDGCRNIP